SLYRGIQDRDKSTPFDKRKFGITLLIDTTSTSVTVPPFRHVHYAFRTAKNSSRGPTRAPRQPSSAITRRSLRSEALRRSEPHFGSFGGHFDRWSGPHYAAFDST